MEIIGGAIAGDARFRLEVDSRSRSSEMAWRHLIDGTETDFVCLLSDDDLIPADYLRSLSKVHGNQSFDLVYSKGFKADGHGRKIGNVLSRKLALEVESFGSPIQRLERYLVTRNSIPANFGMWKTSSLRRYFPTQDFQRDNANLDHVVFARLCWNGGVAHLTTKTTFGYRMRNTASGPLGLGRDGNPFPFLQRIDFLFRTEMLFIESLLQYARQDLGLDDLGVVSTVRATSADYFLRSASREAVRCRLDRTSWLWAGKFIEALATVLESGSSQMLFDFPAVRATQELGDPSSARELLIRFLSEEPRDR